MEIVLQVAVRDIGQLTDLAQELLAAAETTGRSEKRAFKGHARRTVERSARRALAWSGAAGWPGGEQGEPGLSPG
jgi:hypothetical protein